MQYRELWTTCPFQQHFTASLTCSIAGILSTVQVIKVPSPATETLKTIHQNLPSITFLLVIEAAAPSRVKFNGFAVQKSSADPVHQSEVSLNSCFDQREKVRFQSLASIYVLLYCVIKGCFFCFVIHIVPFKDDISVRMTAGFLEPCCEHACL